MAKRRGRRPKGEYPEKKRVFASRIREDTWEMLQWAAAKSGRSFSQEFEFRLRRGLEEDERIESLFGSQDIWSDEACRPGGQINARFEGFESSLDIGSYSVRRAARGNDSDDESFRPMTALDLVAGSPELGAPALAEIVREIQATDPARPLGKISKRQRAALRLQSDLGESG